MHKLIFTGVLALLLHQGNIIAQKPIIQGIALKKTSSFYLGDTINIYGYKPDPHGKTSYLVQSGDYKKYVSAQKIRLLDEDMHYWQKAWFKNQASYITTNGWQKDLRQVLNDDFYEYASQVEINGLVFRDEYLEDYLRQLVFILHPEALIKGETERLNILMIKANKPETFVFNNGTIVITTGQIANTNSEKELLAILAAQTAHVVLDHNLMNLNHEIRSQQSAEFWSAFATIASAVAMEFSNFNYGTNFNCGSVVLAGLTSIAVSDAIMLSAGANFNGQQKMKAENLGMQFIANLEKDEEFNYVPDKEYMINISSILSLTAWQEYHQYNYDRSMFFSDRIFNLGIANEEDYLLRAKLKRTLSNSHETNLEALQLINTAIAMNDFNYVEALAEKGLILIRLNEVKQSREVFEEYKTAISGMPNIPSGRDATWANRMLIKCDQLMLRR